jgi:hypothetical protein
MVKTPASRRLVNQPRPTTLLARLALSGAGLIYNYSKLLNFLLL